MRVRRNGLLQYLVITSVAFPAVHNRTDHTGYCPAIRTFIEYYNSASTTFAIPEFTSAFRKH